MRHVVCDNVENSWKKADIPKLHAFKKAFDKRPNIAKWTGKFEYSGDSMM